LLFAPSFSAGAFLTAPGVRSATSAALSAAGLAAIAMLVPSNMARVTITLEIRLTVINHSIKKQPENVAAFGLLSD
jgi:hypothetical protein